MIEPVTADAASVKEPVAVAAVTTRLTVVLVLAAPVPVPLIVIGYVPATVAAVVASVSVDVVAVTLVGFNVAVTPAGAPDAVSATAPENVPVRVTVIVDVPEAPAATVTDAGDGANVKPDTGAAVTLSASVAVLSETPVLLARTMRFVVRNRGSRRDVDRQRARRDAASKTRRRERRCDAGRRALDRQVNVRGQSTAARDRDRCRAARALLHRQRARRKARDQALVWSRSASRSPPPPHAATDAASTSVINFRIEVPPQEC